MGFNSGFKGLTNEWKIKEEETNKEKKAGHREVFRAQKYWAEAIGPPPTRYPFPAVGPAEEGDRFLYQRPTLSSGRGIGPPGVAAKWPYNHSMIRMIAVSWNVTPCNVTT